MQPKTQPPCYEYVKVLNETLTVAYHWFKFTIDRIQYYAPKVWPNWDSNPWPPDQGPYILWAFFYEIHYHIFLEVWGENAWGLR